MPSRHSGGGGRLWPCSCWRRRWRSQGVVVLHAAGPWSSPQHRGAVGFDWPAAGRVYIAQLTQQGTTPAMPPGHSLSRVTRHRARSRLRGDDLVIRAWRREPLHDLRAHPAAVGRRGRGARQDHLRQLPHPGDGRCARRPPVLLLGCCPAGPHHPRVRRLLLREALARRSCVGCGGRFAGSRSGGGATVAEVGSFGRAAAHLSTGTRSVRRLPGADGPRCSCH